MCKPVATVCQQVRRTYVHACMRLTVSAAHPTERRPSASHDVVSAFIANSNVSFLGAAYAEKVCSGESHERGYSSPKVSRAAVSSCSSEARLQVRTCSPLGRVSMSPKNPASQKHCTPQHYRHNAVRLPQRTGSRASRTARDYLDLAECGLVWTVNSRRMWLF